MNAINVDILRSLFMPFFFDATASSAALMVIGLLPGANGEPRSDVVAAVSAIVIAGTGVVVVAPAGEVAGVVKVAQDIASPGPPAASIILVADQTDLVDVGDFGRADRRCVERRGGSGGRNQHGPECAQCDGLHGVLPSVRRESGA